MGHFEKFKGLNLSRKFIHLKRKNQKLILIKLLILNSIIIFNELRQIVLTHIMQNESHKCSLCLYFVYFTDKMRKCWNGKELVGQH
jgi:hypothetical protein